MENRESEDIRIVPIEEEMQKSYLDYAMSVIISRALPDIRDGLKPVHRRIIYAMNETGNHYNKPYRKSARVVGEVMGKYHPHGDAAIYDTMVRLAQDFSLRVPLVDGQGNFGSMDGDLAAASRYTEARMSLVAHEMVQDIDNDTVDFKPNYDGSIEEPCVLPARFPNLLVNGANGIAVGMATNIPPHNLGEVIDSCIAVIDNPDITTEELMEIIPGPDFPTGAIVMGSGGIRSAFSTGRGSIIVRSRTEIITGTSGRESIIVSEIPYMVNKAKMVERIAELVKEKTVEGISDIRDESNKDGVRVVIEIKKDASAEVILNQLFKYTPLQTSFGYNMLSIVNNKPMRLSIKDMLKIFSEFREDVIVRRSKFRLKKAREKAHVLLGFAMAIANIDEVISIIRNSTDRNEAKNKLMSKIFDVSDIRSMIELVNGVSSDTTQCTLTEIQANAILDLRLHRLTGLEREKIQKDLEEVISEINELISILGSREKIIQIVKEELLEVKEKFNTPRLTTIEGNFDEVDIEDLIQKEDMVVTVTLEGYIKRVPLSTYRSQKRGGKGRNGMDTKEEDVVDSVTIANTHDDILFFTSIGKVYRMKVYNLPLASATSKGRALINLLPVSENEKISTILTINKNTENFEDKTLVFMTSFGNVRRNKCSDFKNIPSNGKKAIGLDEGEKLINVSLCSDTEDIFIATKKGICNRFNATDVRVFSGRESNGVRGIRLQNGDEVMSMAILDKWEIDNIEERETYLKNAEQLRKNAKKANLSKTIIDDKMTKLAMDEKLILTITENGFGKASSFYEYRPTSRGTKGFTNIAITDKNGPVVASFPVRYDDHIMLITNNGRIMRCSVEDIRITRRAAQGVIILRMNSGEVVSSVSVVAENEDNDE
ncbi:MAG: DNA gyrase subunit A [Holosporales bacterium]|jgi:DNA gyrase subunit A|nr:DNA gyrase subunit A [Holosporales bacterium]